MEQKNQEQKKEKNLNEFDIDKLFLRTYNSISVWHNDEGTAPGLKNLTFELIRDITGEVFRHLDIPFNGEVRIDEETKKEALKEKGFNELT